jgi:NAD(P)-dependent dehydrogenase (short-subunit alcohol dehydrogenase family)
MEDRVVLVTGAGRGCGRVIAQDLAREGFDVMLCDVEVKTGEETARTITDAGGKARFMEADVSIEADVSALIDATLSEFGRLDGAVNNAGNEITTKIADAALEDFRTLLATNLEGVFLCMKHEIRALREGGRGGSIVNMGSVTSDITGVMDNGLYAAAKGGVDALTKTAALELAADDISVNAIAFIAADVPNGMFQRFFETADVSMEEVMKMIPAGRLLKEQELTAAVRYLLSPDARFHTGSVLMLDGGFTAQ